MTPSTPPLANKRPVGAEHDVHHVALVKLLPEQQPTARDLPQCDFSKALSAEQFRAIRRERGGLEHEFHSLGAQPSFLTRRPVCTSKIVI